MKNDKYDEAIEVSQSVDQSAAFSPKKGARGNSDAPSTSKGLVRGGEQSKSQSVLNKPFDEALEFSQSGSDESVDTVNEKKKKPTVGGGFEPRQQPKPLESKPIAPSGGGSGIPQGKQSVPAVQQVRSCVFISYLVDI